MKRSLNLMSGPARKREQIRHCLRLWSRVLAGVICILSLWGFVKWQTCHREDLKQVSADSEYEPIRQMKLKSKRLSKQIESIQSTERIPLALSKHQPLLSLIGLATQAVAEHDGKLYLQQIEIERDPVRQETASEPALTFSLEGVAVDSSAVTQLADSLREIGSFATVELSTDKATRVGKQEQQAFSIQCTN